MADEDLLQSWKEVGAYLGRSERTYRRWEKEFRLPIHRMDGSVRGSVFLVQSIVFEPDGIDELSESLLVRTALIDGKVRRMPVTDSMVSINGAPGRGSRC